MRILRQRSPSSCSERTGTPLTTERISTELLRGTLLTLEQVTTSVTVLAEDCEVDMGTYDAPPTDHSSRHARFLCCDH